MVAGWLHDRKVVVLNPAGSYETAISKLKPYCLLQHIAINKSVPPKSYTAGLHQVLEAIITTQSVQPQGEIPEECRKNHFKNLDLLVKLFFLDSHFN